MKSVLTGTYEKFFDTSRAQDRIVVYFGGHVRPMDGKVYLVPIEGDPDEPASLIPSTTFTRNSSCARRRRRWSSGTFAGSTPSAAGSGPEVSR